MIYFHVHDARWFHDQFLPTLRQCRRQRSFAPCHEICRELQPAVQAYCERYHIGEQPLISHIEGAAFSPDLWRIAVGELLVFGAIELPEMNQAPELLCGLARELPMQQVHYGTRELCFGVATYRTQSVRWNDVNDVQRLANYLTGLATDSWTAANAAQDKGEAEQELAYALECLAELLEMYQQTAKAARVLVAEIT